MLKRKGEAIVLRHAFFVPQDMVWYKIGLIAGRNLFILQYAYVICFYCCTRSFGDFVTSSGMLFPKITNGVLLVRRLPCAAKGFKLNTVFS